MEKMRREKRFAGGQRALFIFLGLVLLALAALLGTYAAKGAGNRSISNGISRFDSSSGAEKAGSVDFVMLSDSFATFSAGERHGIFAVFDRSGQIYLACLPINAPDLYADIYDFTFSSTRTEFPAAARITGYPVKIEAELRNMAIEYLNEVYFDDNTLTVANFSDYLGSYYLDTTYQPEADRTPLLMGVMAVLFAAAGIFFLVLQGKRKKGSKAVLSDGSGDNTAQTIYTAFHENAAAPVVPPLGAQPPSGETAFGGVPLYTSQSAEGTSWGSDPWEDEKLQPAGRQAAGILGALLGALVGGVIWVAVYQLGYVAGIASLAGVALALSWYQKFSGKLDGFGIFVSVTFSFLVMVLANVFAYSLSIYIEIEKSHPGRSSFFYILANFNTLMKSVDGWGSFFGDLFMGILLGAVASVGAIAQAMSSVKKKTR